MLLEVLGGPGDRPVGGHLEQIGNAGHKLERGQGKKCLGKVT